METNGLTYLGTTGGGYSWLTVWHKICSLCLLLRGGHATLRKEEASLQGLPYSPTEADLQSWHPLHILLVLHGNPQPGHMLLPLGLSRLAGGFV